MNIKTDDEYRKIFHKNLNYYMNKLGKTQADLIKDLGFSSSTVSNWCTGLKLPRMGKIQLLADYFGINKSDLIEDKEMTLGQELTSTEEKIIANLRKFNLSEEKEIIENIQTKLVLLNKDGLNKTDDYISDLIDNPKYYNGTIIELNAAHTIPGAAEEEKKHDDDIMDDENF